MRTFKTGVEVGGDARGGVTALNLTKKGLEEAGRAAKNTGSRISKFSKDARKSFSEAAKTARMYSGIAVAAASAAGAAMVKSGLSQVDTLAKTSDKLGIATESLAKLRFAAEQTGVSQKTLDVGLQRFTRRLADAATGTGPAVSAFEALGLSAEELVNKSPDEALAEVADRMKLVENQSQKVGLAFKLFDSEGVGLVNTLQGGSEGLNELGRQAEVAGLAISRVDAAKVEAANDAMNRARAGVSGFSQQLAVKFAPLLEDIANRIFGVGKESWGMAAAAGKAFDFVVKAAGTLANGIHAIEIGWIGMKLGFQLAARGLLSGFDAMAKKIAETWNSLPLVGEENYVYQSRLSGFLATMDSEIAESQARIRSKLDEELPSRRIEEYTETVERQFTAAAEKVVEGMEDVQDEVITTEAVTNSLTKTTETAAKSFAEQWSEALIDTRERINSAFADAWKGAFDSFGEFKDRLLDAFKQTIAELAHIAITKPIVMNFGAALGLGGVSGAAQAAGGVGGLGGLSSLVSGAGSFLSNPLGSIGNFGAGLYNSIGQGASFLADLGIPGMDSLSTASFGKGMTMTGGQMLGNLGAGLAGGLLGNAVFGETSGIGSTLGGIAGSFVPVPFVGTAIGSFLGAGIESLFGSRPKNRISSAAIGADGANFFAQGNADTTAAVNELAGPLNAFREILGGSTTTIGANVGSTGGLYLSRQWSDTDRSGPNFNGHTFQYGDDQEGFMRHAFDQLIAGAEQLSGSLRSLLTNFDGTSEELMAFTSNMVSISEMIGGNAVRDLRAAAVDLSATSLSDAYYSQIDAISELVSNFDGSALSAQNLNAAMAQNQQTAVSLALQYQQISGELSGMFAGSAQQIRESVMTEQELAKARREERDALRDSISTLTDPQAIRDAASEVNRLNLELFNSIKDPTQQQAEVFANYAERTEEITRNRIEEMLNGVETSLDQRNQAVRDVMESTAQRNQQAAVDLQAGVASFGGWVQQLIQRGATVDQLAAGLGVEAVP